jgi:hypothetical protein
MPFHERQSDDGLVASSVTVTVAAPARPRTCQVTAVAGPMPFQRHR